MSRLDYVTIAIVAVCVAALVYLIYMTTNLLGDSGDSGTTAQTTAPATSEEDAGEDTDTYTFNDGNRTEDSDEAGSQADAGYDYPNEENLDNEQAPASGSATTASPGEMDTESNRVAEEEYTPRGSAATSSGSTSKSGSSSGQYMVMAGTFGVKTNAQSMEKKLRGLGYNNVVLEPFDRGKYTVVMVDRFNSISEAKSLAKELENKGIEAYVKQK